ncbi:sugar lactone lactonase YvrE [Methylorubrum extorquens]
MPTGLLDAPGTAPETLSGAVERVAITPSTGATAIVADGTLFVSDTDTRRILRIAPDGTVSSLIEDTRLLRVDAMWIDATGRFWMPAAQINRLALFQGGTSRARAIPGGSLHLAGGRRAAPNDHR